MKKLPALCLAIAALFYASAADCRICFLGDLDCQEGKFSADGSVCSDQGGYGSWINEYARCEDLVYGNVICNDYTGNYYEPGRCPDDSVDMDALTNPENYVCKREIFGQDCIEHLRCCGELGPGPGPGPNPCVEGYVECSDKFFDCNDYDGTHGEGERCTDNSGANCSEVVKYERCVCDGGYGSGNPCPDGLEPDTGSDMCRDSDGQTYYDTCTCPDGYYKVSASELATGCSDYGENGGYPTSYHEHALEPGYYCWNKECREIPDEVCENPHQSDFDKFWKGYDIQGDNQCHNLEIDCATLGYNTCSADINTKCKDGSEPFRCPFDHMRVYCESGCATQKCDYDTQNSCETYNYNSICSKDAEGCWNPTACKTDETSNYATSVSACANGVPGDWSLDNPDDFGCGKCSCSSNCYDKISSSQIPANASPTWEVCSACNQSIQIISGFSCNQGYTISQDGKSCVAACGPEYNLTECIPNGICSECDGKYKLDSCKENTGLYNGQCIILCSFFDNTYVISDTDPKLSYAMQCLDNSTIKWAYKYQGVLIRRTENADGGYSYRCTTTIGDGSKIEYILSGPYGNCYGDIRRGTCNGSTLNINVNGEVRLCSLYPVVDDQVQKNRCALFNYDSTAGIFNANLDYGNKATVAINPDTVLGEDKVQCVINGSSTVEVTFNY